MLLELAVGQVVDLVELAAKVVVEPVHKCRELVSESSESAIRTGIGSMWRQDRTRPSWRSSAAVRTASAGKIDVRLFFFGMVCAFVVGVCARVQFTWIL